MSVELKFGSPAVEGILDMPKGKPRAAMTLAHGAGAGMRHKFLSELALALAAQGVAVLRFQFPYMQAGRKMPDQPKVAVATIASAVTRLAEECPGVPIFSSGKSFGARMSSTGASEGALAGCKGLVSFGYPLHPPEKPGTERAKHLDHVKIPHLILQGDRDKLAQLDLLEEVCRKFPGVTLHVVKGADHGFDVLKSSGRTHVEVMDELVREAVRFVTV